MAFPPVPTNLRDWSEVVTAIATVVGSVVAIFGLFRVSARVQSQTAQRTVDQLVGDVNAFALYPGRDAKLLATLANTRSAYLMALETIFETRARVLAEIRRLPWPHQRRGMRGHVETLINIVRAHARNDLAALARVEGADRYAFSEWMNAVDAQLEIYSPI